MDKAPKNIKKLYYSIGEVSKITELKQYVLRYWETEFNILKPGSSFIYDIFYLIPKARPFK